MFVATVIAPMILSAACIKPEPTLPIEPCSADKGLSTKSWRLVGYEGSYNFRLPPHYDRWKPRTMPFASDTDVRIWRGPGCRSIKIDFGASDIFKFEGSSIEYSQCIQQISGHRAQIVIGWDATGQLSVPEGYMCRTYAVVAVWRDVPMTFIGTTASLEELPQLLAALHSVSIEREGLPPLERERAP